MKNYPPSCFAFIFMILFPRRFFRFSKLRTGILGGTVARRISNKGKSDGKPVRGLRGARYDLHKSCRAGCELEGCGSRGSLGELGDTTARRSSLMNPGGTCLYGGSVRFY